MREKKERKTGELSRMVKRPSNLTLNRREGAEGPSETLTSAVMSALMLGTPSAQIALQFGLPPATVRKWEEAYDISNPLKRRDRLSEMLMVFLEQEISSLMTISIATQDEEWIKEQSATDLSTYIATKQDRLIRILETYGRAQESTQEIEGDYTRDD